MIVVTTHVTDFSMSEHMRVVMNDCMHDEADPLRFIGKAARAGFELFA